mgnify:CR=1 FL=1
MAKATLEFDLDNPDDLVSFNRAVKADAMASCLWEIVNNTWRKFKYVEGDIDYEDYKQAVWDEVQNHSLNMDDLWR